MRETIQNQFLFRKRGVFYFSRRVPSDLARHYSRSRIVLSLRTRSPKVASARATALASNLESDWLTLRWRSKDDAIKRFLRDPWSAAADASSAPTMSEARDRYIEAKKAGRPITFAQAAMRAVRYLEEVSGDKPIDAYTRADVNALRDRLYERGLNQASVKRTLNVVRAIANFMARKHGIDNVKAFSGVYLGERETSPSEKRTSIPADALANVQRECREKDDEPRWIIALISDTGLRLSEACGLATDDILLNGLPHIRVQPHPWRRLKTAASERLVPLVGTSLWAAARALEEADSEFLFPRYCSAAGCKANSASANLNKWLASRVPEGRVIHSLRHSLRDRLRAVQCPAEITDRLGGWTVGGVGEGYGSGYPLEVLSEWMTKIASE